MAVIYLFEPLPPPSVYGLFSCYPDMIVGNTVVAWQTNKTTTAHMRDRWTEKGKRTKTRQRRRRRIRENSAGHTLTVNFRQGLIGFRSENSPAYVVDTVELCGGLKDSVAWAERSGRTDKCCGRCMSLS